MVKLLLWGSAKGVGMVTAASKMARRCATSAARCATNRRMSSGTRCAPQILYRGAQSVARGTACCALHNALAVASFCFVGT
jgi:hypothetical protein